MVSKKRQIDAEFLSAQDNWNLEKLYLDLAMTKKKPLTVVEKSLLRGLLSGCSPSEIAAIVYQSRNSSTVRVYLCNGLYKYIEELLSSRTGNSVKIQNWSRVAQLLEKAGYKRNTLAQARHNDVTVSRSYQQDWGEATDVSLFYGRSQELRSLEQWIVNEKCRLVAIVGFGGIGKTALSIKIVEQVQQKFQFVIWRSLVHAPLLSDILAQLLQIFAHQPHFNSSNTTHNSISLLIQQLRTHRCLLVLDNFETVLASGEQSFTYRQGYEDYAELIRRVGESSHQSCLAIASREVPKEISSLQGSTLPVRVLKLSGLTPADAALLLHSKGIVNFSEQECNLIVDCYTGNPLFLKTVATALQNLLVDNISKLLAQDTIILSDIREVLNQQFSRLSRLEKQIVYCLALSAQTNSITQLQQTLCDVPQVEIFEAIFALRQRNIIDHSAKFVQRKLFEAYIVEQLSELFFDKIKHEPIATVFTKKNIIHYLKHWIAQNQD